MRIILKILLKLYYSTGPLFNRNQIKHFCWCTKACDVFIQEPRIYVFAYSAAIFPTIVPPLLLTIDNVFYITDGRWLFYIAGTTESVIILRGFLPAVLLLIKSPGIINSKNLKLWGKCLSIYIFMYIYIYTLHVNKWYIYIYMDPLYHHKFWCRTQSV